jgi:hypothetical protein
VKNRIFVYVLHDLCVPLTLERQGLPVEEEALVFTRAYRFLERPVVQRSAQLVAGPRHLSASPPVRSQAGSRAACRLLHTHAASNFPKAGQSSWLTMSASSPSWSTTWPVHQAQVFLMA